MTKLRAPLSFERAIVRMADELGWATMGAMVEKSPRTVQDWSDPDVPSRISLHDAFTFEEAYVAAGGEGHPISDCWRLRLGIGASTSGCAGAALAGLFAKACKEGGEASAAVAQFLGAGSGGDRRLARREVAEQIDALSQILVHLDSEAPAGGPSGSEVPPSTLGASVT